MAKVLWCAYEIPLAVHFKQGVTEIYKGKEGFFFRQLIHSQAQADQCSLFLLYAYHSMTAFQCIFLMYLSLSTCERKKLF